MLYKTGIKGNVIHREVWISGHEAVKNSVF